MLVEFALGALANLSCVEGAWFTFASLLTQISEVAERIRGQDGVQLIKKAIGKCSSPYAEEEGTRALAGIELSS